MWSKVPLLLHPYINEICQFERQLNAYFEPHCRLNRSSSIFLNLLQSVPLDSFLIQPHSFVFILLSFLHFEPINAPYFHNIIHCLVSSRKLLASPTTSFLILLQTSLHKISFFLSLQPIFVYPLDLHLSWKVQMSRKASKRVSFSPDVNDKPTVELKKGGGDGGTGIWSFGRSRDTRYLRARFLHGLKARVSEAIRYVSTRKSSRKVSSASTFTRSRSVSDSLVSHRAEAIEDCIEFLNHSSSLSRSSSVSGTY